MIYPWNIHEMVMNQVLVTFISHRVNLRKMRKKVMIWIEDNKSEAASDVIADGHGGYGGNDGHANNNHALNAELMVAMHVPPSPQRIMTCILLFVYGQDPLDGQYPNWPSKLCLCVFADCV